MRLTAFSFGTVKLAVALAEGAGSRRLRWVLLQVSRRWARAVRWLLADLLTGLESLSLALTLLWAETLPFLRRARRLGPYDWPSLCAGPGNWRAARQAGSGVYGRRVDLSGQEPAYGIGWPPSPRGCV